MSASIGGDCKISSTVTTAVLDVTGTADMVTAPSLLTVPTKANVDCCISSSTWKLSAILFSVSPFQQNWLYPSSTARDRSIFRSRHSVPTTAQYVHRSEERRVGK